MDGLGRGFLDLPFRLLFFWGDRARGSPSASLPEASAASGACKRAACGLCSAGM